MNEAAARESGNTNVFEDLMVLCEGCSDDLWKVAAMLPNGLLGQKRRRAITALLDDLSDYAPNHLQQYASSEQFEPVDLTNTEAAMLLGICLRALQVSANRAEERNLAS